MRLNSIIFSVILLVWMGASTYWYVCKIQDDCGKLQTSSSVILNTKESQKKYINNDVIEGVEQRTEQEKSEIISSVKEKLTRAYTIYSFPKGSDINNDIKADFNEFADGLVLYLQENSSSKIEIIGYADNSGSKKTNLFFGKQRALFIKNKLINKGIDKNVFIIKSMGEANPVASNKTKKGRLQNRRVVIKLIDKK